MSIKRFFKSLAAAAMTAAIVTAMSTAAFAAPITSVDFTKYVTTDGNTYAPNTTFTYSVVPGDAVSALSYDSTTASVYAGIAGAITLGDTTGVTTFAPDTTNAPAVQYDQTAQLTLSGTPFNAKNENGQYTVPAGIYHYVFSETQGTYDGVTYSTEVYDLYLFVYTNTDGSRYIGNVIAAKRTSADTVNSVINNNTKNTLEFTNAYTTKNLTITKAVTGNQGDKTKLWEFKVTVTGADGEKYKVVYKVDGSSAETTTCISTGVEQSFSIKNGGSIVVYGLSPNDTYSVDETEKNNDNYTTTYQLNGGNSTSMTAAVTGSEGESNNTVAVTNNKDVVTPTGIILTYAPYILLVAGAAVFAVVFFRRRRNAED